MTRQVVMVFFGNAREREGVHPHESPRVMLIPLMTLAVLASIGEFVDLPFKSLEYLNDWLQPVFRGVSEPTEHFTTGLGLSLVALAMAVLGIYAAYRWYRNGLQDRTDTLPTRLGPVGTLFSHAWFFDEGISALVRGPVQRLASFTSNVFDGKVIDGAVNGVGVLHDEPVKNYADYKLVCFVIMQLGLQSEFPRFLFTAIVRMR